MRNLTLLTDYYELLMMQTSYLEYGKDEPYTCFDMFYRRNPFGNGFSVFCGLNELIEYIKKLRFEKDDIEYLRSLGSFKEEFLEYLSDFKFTGDIYSFVEGSVVFPNEPIIKVIAKIGEAQLIEAALLSIINHNILIATKAHRIVYAAGDKPVMEFGLRRSQNVDAGYFGSRTAVIAGCIGTSNVLAAKDFNMVPMGTHAHSLVMSHESELEAFRRFAKDYPDNCILLIDTYDTLKSGLENAIKVFKEMREAGIKSKKYGIRLDSGDLAYLSKKIRERFDKEGFNDALICASNDLDEDIITSLKDQGAKIDLWGVGTKLITGDGAGSLGGVYKLSAIKKKGSSEFEPKIKISENTEKITNPGDKEIYRIYDKKTGKLIADYICLATEDAIDDKYCANNDLHLFDPKETWKSTLLKKGEYTSKRVLNKIFENGNCVFKIQTVDDAKGHLKSELSSMWEESKRLVNPHETYVDLSKKLWDLKQNLLMKKQ